MAFIDSGLTSVYLPNIESLGGQSQFLNSKNLKTVEITGAVSNFTIPQNCFENCTSLTDVTITNAKFFNRKYLQQ